MLASFEQAFINASPVRCKNRCYQMEPQRRRFTADMKVVADGKQRPVL